VSLFLGNGKGQFLNTAAYQVGGSLVPLAMADFNGDHRPDLATVDEDGDTVTVLLNTGAR
jgi:hypothetical protein